MPPPSRSRRAIRRARRAIHVDPAHRLGERKDRVGGVIFRAQQARFLGRHGKEDEAAFGRARIAMRLSQSHQRRGACGIVDRAIADVVARIVGRAAAQVIPVRCVQHDSSGRAAPGRMPITLLEAKRREELSKLVDTGIPSEPAETPAGRRLHHVAKVHSRSLEYRRAASSGTQPFIVV